MSSMTHSYTHKTHESSQQERGVYHGQLNNASSRMRLRRKGTTQQACARHQHQKQQHQKKRKKKKKKKKEEKNEYKSAYSAAHWLTLSGDCGSLLASYSYVLTQVCA
ncbi:hypothetical protein CGRA01v4_14706 [Colletotrichum graminicola]|nr:hypothetical protein CGRA01v4_14706 [Colletotrichum graminicola]